MKIKSMKIKNFRGYKDSGEIKFDDLTAFVGKNDAGKSTILDALDIFFNDGKGTVKLDKADLNVQEAQNENDETVISVAFSDLPEKIVIDSSVETSLKDEYMLNKQGELEIIRKYKNGGTAKTFIYAYHPANPRCADLLLKKNSDLKKLAQAEEIECKDLSSNPTLRKNIWDAFSDDLQLVEQEIDISKEDAKKIWGKVSAYLPVFSLFQSDRKNNDGDAEVQDPLKVAVNQILSEEHIQEMLSEISGEVEEKLRDVSNRTLEKLREMDPSIADSLNPVIPPSSSLRWPDVFKNVSISGDGNIPINKRGSGVKRLVLLNFFRAEAERRAQEADGTGIIYAIEEPETSQHSNNQILLIEAFKSLNACGNAQVILTTHSPYVVKQLNFSNIRVVNVNDDNTRKITEVLPAQLNYPSLNEVNYIAFGEITEEYHDELYGYIDFRHWKNEYASGKPTILYHMLKKDGTTYDQQIILTVYIRHQIHHPENHHNTKYTKEQLGESIRLMREFIQSKKDEGEIIEPW